MKKTFAVVATVFLLVTLVIGIFFVEFTHSPEYALKETLSDFKAEGYSGLREHLTSDVAEKLDGIIALSENRIIGNIFSAVADSDYTKQLLSESSKINWELGDVLRNNKKASVTVCFSYENLFSGSVDIDMAMENGEWRISGIDLPKFN